MSQQRGGIMFRKSPDEKQLSLMSSENLLSGKKLKRLNETKEHCFYELILKNIAEDDFAVLYSENGSRPNTPVNIQVGALILQSVKAWSYNELFEHIDFDLRTRRALGLTDLEEQPFSSATIFNFQNRLMDHYVKTGENLLEKVFDKLTKQQIKELKIKADIQRTDSFLAASNIRKYGRTQLLIEVLLRMYRELTGTDKKRTKKYFEKYLKQSSSQYIYKLERTDIPKEVESLKGIYEYLHEDLKAGYSSTKAYEILARVYGEQFRRNKDGILEVIPLGELSSSQLQSPDDLDATYRKKRTQESRGQSINITETANPDNELNLITDVAVATNNIDDSRILNDRLDLMKDKTPELSELHTDGGYGSAENDRKMEELGIIQIQTAIKGKQSGISFVIEKLDETYRIECPYQSVVAIATKNRYKANFQLMKCEACPYTLECQSLKQKMYRTVYFTEENYLAQRRNANIKNISIERRKIRPNVEATVKEFSSRMPQGKLKVRGAFKTAMFAFTTAIAINFGRIYRRTVSNLGNTPYFKVIFSFFVQLLSYFGAMLKANNMTIAKNSKKQNLAFR